ncbi:virion structural protein [Erwinia phage vB_EamM_ChrisDB]|uniref:virion structural protein n=1 Tax=Erwinia phage vB_EamM_ChrisDB TaxID=1883371 RepID=UPI00081C665A|nr:virion structural protein [Erwinia phage vB_EamM_ChrisDB]ANZ48657.1 putative virion structural protein [Erwinia phage vB_EamM_ChrisDB]
MDDISKLTARDPAVSAILRKATGPSATQERGKRQEGGTTPTRSELTGIASSRIRTTKNAQRIYQALPELETIVTIATSSLLSSKDLINTSLIYDCVTDVPLDLKETLLGIEREYHDNVRKLPTKLYKWIYDALKSKGATPVLLLSDSGFDSLFGLDTRVAQESARAALRTKQVNFFTEQTGALRKIAKPGEQKVGIESILSSHTKPDGPQEIKFDLSGMFGKDSGFTEMKVMLTDNRNVFMMPEVVRRVARENASSSFYGQLEQAAYEKPTTPTGGGTFDPRPVRDQEANKIPNQINIADLNETYRTPPEQMFYAEMKKAQMDDVNRLEYVERILPAESTLPLILGDDVMNPIGYLAIVDEQGNFINARSSLYGDANFMNYLNNDGMIDSTINRAAIGMGEGNAKVTPEIANRLVSRFGEIAENQLALSLGDALGGAELDINVTETFGRVMLTRHLAKRHTQVVYIPAESLCYFATDFDEDGIGVSITERAFIISSVRMALLFATMNSAILNSARHMQYDIQLSPDAMNGEEAVAKIKSDILNSYNRRQPMWGNMDDVWAMSTNAGIAFNVEGNEHYSSHKISVSDTTPDYKVPDQALDESLLRRTCHIAGVDPDLVLTPDNIEFASQIFSKSLLVTQQIVKKQEILQKPLTRYVVTSTLSSPKLQAEMLEAIVTYIKENEPDTPETDYVAKASAYMGQFINGIKVSLPPPDTSAANSQMDLFDKRMEFFEKLADLVVTDDISAMLQEAGVSMDPNNVKSMVKTFYARNWLRRQGIENDFFDLIYDNDKRPENVKMMSDDVADASKTIIQLAKRAQGKIETLAKQADVADENGGGFGGNNLGGGSDDGLGGDDSLGGDDDGLGGDDSLGGNDDGLGGDDGLGSDDGAGGDDTGGDGADANADGSGADTLSGDGTSQEEDIPQ